MIKLRMGAACMFFLWTNDTSANCMSEEIISMTIIRLFRFTICYYILMQLQRDGSQLYMMNAENCISFLVSGSEM